MDHRLHRQPNTFSLQLLAGFTHWCYLYQVCTDTVRTGKKLLSTKDSPLPRSSQSQFRWQFQKPAGFIVNFSDCHIWNDTKERKFRMCSEISSNFSYLLPREIPKCNNKRYWWNLTESMPTSDLSNEFNWSLYTYIKKRKNLLGGYIIYWCITSNICYDVRLYISLPWSQNCPKSCQQLW